MVPLLAMILVSPVVQAVGEPSSDARMAATAGSSRADLAQLEAPIGHRQPTLDDLPPWLREEEKAGTGQAQRKSRKLAVQTSSKKVVVRNNNGRRACGRMTAFHEICDPC
jgi:hypothetical protein